MIDFSLYPNLNGNLGENKVAIPESYGMFISEEDAAMQMRLTRIVNE
jgi:hypothetical protein